MRTRLPIALVLALLGGCKASHHHGTPAAAGHPHAAGALAPAKPARHSPLTQAEFSTTSGAIAVDNLTGQLEGYRKSVERDPTFEQNVTALLDLLTTRAQFLGRLSDYDEAARIADAEVARSPSEAGWWMLRASTRSAFHRFDDALADLAEAEKRGTAAEKIAAARATIAEARGDLAAALPLRRKLAETRPDLLTLGAEASLLGDLGRTDEAEVLFVDAQDRYRDTSPFGLAWLYFQQGLMWARTGADGRARELYQAALDRVPAYAPAVSHLADLDAKVHDQAGAIALLRPLAEQSEDPEFAGQLAALLSSSDPAEAARLREKARTGFEALLAKHPEAFADHAARFYLGAGGDAKRALTLAQLNLKNRPTHEAFQLTLEAALAAGDSVLACSTADRALAPGGGAGIGLRILAARAYGACGQRERADAELHAASTIR